MVVGGNIYRYYYDGFDLVAAYDGSNILIATAMFGRGIDSPISFYDDGDVYYYHSDALGSVTEMTDDAETVVRTYEYSAFGEILSQTGTLANPFTYTARELDTESGLYYYRNRYYSPEMGRFMTHDPIYWFGGVNLYLYVFNNPLAFVDPFGQGTRINVTVAVGGAIVGIIGATIFMKAPIPGGALIVLGGLATIWGLNEIMKDMEKARKKGEESIRGKGDDDRGNKDTTRPSDIHDEEKQKEFFPGQEEGDARPNPEDQHPLAPPQPENMCLIG